MRFLPRRGQDVNSRYLSEPAPPLLTSRLCRTNIGPDGRPRAMPPHWHICRPENNNSSSTLRTVLVMFPRPLPPSVGWRHPGKIERFQLPYFVVCHLALFALYFVRVLDPLLHDPSPKFPILLVQLRHMGIAVSCVISFQLGVFRFPTFLGRQVEDKPNRL